MISAFARAARILDNESYFKQAETAAQFIFKHLQNEDGRLLRRYRDGDARYLGYLSDYAQMAQACLDLYEYSYEAQWLIQAQKLAQDAQQLFASEAGPFYETGSDAEVLLTRKVDGYDGVEPSGNSTLASVFLKLHDYGLMDEGWDEAQKILTAFHQHLLQAGASYSAMHWALHYQLSNPKQVLVIGERNTENTQAILQILRKQYLPNQVVLFATPDEVESLSDQLPLLKNRTWIQQKTTVYVCHNQVCDLPIHTTEDLLDALDIEPESIV